MLLMAEKFVEEGICHANYRYAKAHSKYMKNYYKIKELSEMYMIYMDGQFHRNVTCKCR